MISVNILPLRALLHGEKAIPRAKLVADDVLNKLINDLWREHDFPEQLVLK